MAAKSYRSLSERLASTGDPSLLSAFCSKGVFISGPAECEEVRYRGSCITSADESTDLIPGWESGKGDAEMFFPIHTCCITLSEHLCYFRSAQFPQLQDLKSVPAHLEEFCGALNRRRERNEHPTLLQLQKRGYTYANDGGLEWDHRYYGAQQSWGDGWESQAHGEVRICTG